jgi:uncharacterized protein (DUF736 family)
MKKFLLSTLITIAGLFTMAAGAWAETGAVVVQINEDFIAGGATLPAGTYKVYLGSPETGQTLTLRGEKGSVYLIPKTHDPAFSGQLTAKLKRVGEVYYLSEVTTDLGVYTFPAPRSLTRMAKAKDQELKPASGGN